MEPMDVDNNSVNGINVVQNGDVNYTKSASTIQQQQQTNDVVTTKSKVKDELHSLMERVKPSSYNQKRNYSCIDISAEKWLMAYDKESLMKLENPPSLADGISKELEKDIRYLGCELIQSGAILLKLNQTSAATAQILFQRYYYQKSFVRYNFEHSVMACLLLASKIEEEPRKPRDVINVYHRLKQLHQHTRRCQQQASNHSELNLNPAFQHLKLQQRPKKFEHLELSGLQYSRTKNEVIKAEMKLLKTLGFVVHVHHPHKLIYIYLHILNLLPREGGLSKNTQDIRQQLLQRAWSYMNDGLRTDMFLRYTPETIACACIQLAVKTVKHPIVLPKDPFPWFELFDASDRDVRAISQMLLDLYARTRAPSLDWIHAQLEKFQEKIDDEQKELKKKQFRALASMKEAIEQRKSEIAAAVLATKEKAQKIAKSDEQKLLTGRDEQQQRERDGKSTKTSTMNISGRERDRATQLPNREKREEMNDGGRAGSRFRDRDNRDHRIDKDHQQQQQQQRGGEKGEYRGRERGERDRQQRKRSRSKSPLLSSSAKHNFLVIPPAPGKSGIRSDIGGAKKTRENGGKERKY